MCGKLGDIDQYVLAAAALYVDTIGIFIYLVQMIGGGDD